VTGLQSEIVVGEVAEFKVRIHAMNSDDGCKNGWSAKYIIHPTSNKESNSRYQGSIRIDHVMDDEFLIMSTVFFTQGLHNLVISEHHSMWEDKIQNRYRVEKYISQIQVVGKKHKGPSTYATNSRPCNISLLEDTSFGAWINLTDCQQPYCTGIKRKSYKVEKDMTFVPFQCHLHYYTPEEVIARFKNNAILFLGDSTMEDLIESLTIAMGFDEDTIIDHASDTLNYTDANQQIVYHNHYYHRYMTVEMRSQKIFFYHRFTGHYYPSRNKLGTTTFWHHALLDYVRSHFPPYNDPIRQPTPQLIVFNSGHHDMIRRFSQFDEYRRNMIKLATLMTWVAKQYNVKLLWKTTTPMMLFPQTNLINDIATEIMRSFGIPVFDLSGPITVIDHLKNDYSDGCHFGVWSSNKVKDRKLTVNEAMTTITLTSIFEMLK